MQINLFAEETQLQRLSELGDSLEKLNVIDFVFASCFISTTCVLNGRKVMTQIL